MANKVWKKRPPVYHCGNCAYCGKEHLSNEGADITVIDSNTDAIQKVTELYDVQGVLGLASYPNILEDA